MSQDDLHAAANADTPKEIQVPNTPWALAAWVLARFGVGGGVIMAVLYGINVVYADLKAEGQSKTRLMEQVIQLQTSSVQAIENIAREVKDTKEEVEDLNGNVKRHVEQEMQERMRQ